MTRVNINHLFLSKFHEDLIFQVSSHRSWTFANYQRQQIYRYQMWHQIKSNTFLKNYHASVYYDRLFHPGIWKMPVPFAIKNNNKKHKKAPKKHMLLVLTGIASERQFQWASTPLVFMAKQEIANKWCLSDTPARTKHNGQMDNPLPPPLPAHKHNLQGV